MKKTLLFFFMLAALCMQARNREVRLRLIATSDIHGNYLPYDYISQQPGKGGLSRVYTYVKLQREQLGKEQVVVLDNGDIVYRGVTQAPLKKTAIKRYFSSTGNTETIVRSTRNSVQPESTIEANNVTTGTDFQLHLTINGEKRILSPLGSDKRYLWPSISPDGKRLLFFVSADCAYVSDIDGKNAKPMGILRAPKWYGNDIIIGQRDRDNGYVTTSSSIIAKNISTGKEQVLTKDDMIAMYPSVSKNGDKILFSTPEGKAYIIHVNVKQ